MLVALGWPRSLPGQVKRFTNMVKINLGTGGAMGRGGGDTGPPLGQTRWTQTSGCIRLRLRPLLDPTSGFCSGRRGRSGAGKVDLPQVPVTDAWPKPPDGPVWRPALRSASGGTAVPPGSGEGEADGMGQRAQCRAARMRRGLDHLFSEERLRELGCSEWRRED